MHGRFGGKNSEKNKVFECSVQQWIITSGGWLTDLLTNSRNLARSQWIISFRPCTNDQKRHRGLIRLRIFKMRWVSVANDHLGPKPLISDSATRRSQWPLQCQPVASYDNEWQISKTLIQSSIQTHGQVSKKSYRVSQNYPNMYFSTIISTALKPLKMWIPKFSEILIKRQR